MDCSWYISPEEYKQAEKNGICKNTLESRIRDFRWDHKKAITVKPRENNIWPKEVMELIKANEIPYSTFYGRVYKLRWSIKKASTTPVRKKKKQNVKRPFIPFKYEEMAKDNGINKGTFQSRIFLLNWPLKKAATTPVRGR